MNRNLRHLDAKANRTQDERRAKAEIDELLRLGAKLHRAAQFSEAEDCYRRALEAEPRHADALHLLGLLALEQRRGDVAVELILQAIKLDEKPEYLCNLANALAALSRFGEAAEAYNRAIGIKPDLAEACFGLGNALKAQGKLDEAVSAYRGAILSNSNYAAAYLNLGNALREQGLLDEAIAAYRQATLIRPDYANALCNLGAALKQSGRVDEAIAEYLRALVLHPNDAETHCNLGGAFFDQGKLEEAVESCRQAIALNPGLAEAHNNFGLALMQLGQLPEARAALEDAVRLAPRNPKYRLDLGVIKRFAAGDPQLAEMERLAGESASLPAEDKIELHFALARAYENVGRHSEAFRQYLDGNALKRRQIPYDEAATLATFDRIREISTARFIGKWDNPGVRSPNPIFIVGMARSGSTLIEQILASNKQVFGGGELALFPDAVQAIRGSSGRGRTYPEILSELAEADCRDLASHYLAELVRLAPGAVRVTDKMPSNFFHAGLIHLALPNARIIHTMRDPLDTCWSCFSRLFSGEQNHTYDLAELGRYYRRYRGLMAHWHAVLPPGRILDVRYEDVVADLEGQARRIVAHCGLEWDPQCLDFHRTPRPVRTASAVEVRQPIYDHAVGRWRAYRNFLGPLTKELDAVTPASRRGL
jgi:tetratricopeptide (TPR) repeat protein